MQKIVVGADIYAFSDYNGFLGNTNILTVKGTADVNLNVEYLFNKRLSFFGKLNNLANQRYQLYANYPVYGINGLVGAKFSF
jgi:outer membrane receptor protein involved in Fe transport